jgi:hypothetical protein
MTEEIEIVPDSQQRLLPLTLKTVITHTVTYFLVGVLALILLQYGQQFAEPRLASYMRQTDDPWVMAGPLFQPLRGLIFASVFYLLRAPLFGRRRGWVLIWWLLFALGVLSTFGPAPGSLEGIVYTRLSWRDHLLGLPEALAQTLSMSVVLFYWVRHPEKRWLSWLLWVIFALVLLLPTLGLLIGRNGG